MYSHRPSFSIPAFALALRFAASTQTPALITLPINESQPVALAGNTRPEANPANDLSRVSDDLVMSHMLPQLQRSPQGEADLDEFIQQLSNPKSANYHQWLTAAAAIRQSTFLARGVPNKKERKA
jgi:hypothetical protein